MTRDITCACGCGRTGAHWARGLIRACYRRIRRAGHLSDYPVRGLTADQVREVMAAMAAARAGLADARREDYADLRSWGLSPREAAARIGVSERTAWRYEKHHRTHTTQEKSAAA